MKHSLLLRQQSPCCCCHSPMRPYQFIRNFVDALVTMHWQGCETLLRCFAKVKLLAMRSLVFRYAVVCDGQRSWPSCYHIAIYTFMFCHWGVKRSSKDRQANHFCDVPATYSQILMHYQSREHCQLVWKGLYLHRSWHVRPCFPENQKCDQAASFDEQIDKPQHPDQEVDIPDQCSENRHKRLKL